MHLAFHTFTMNRYTWSQVQTKMTTKYSNEKISNFNNPLPNSSIPSNGEKYPQPCIVVDSYFLLFRTTSPSLPSTLFLWRSHRVYVLFRMEDLHVGKWHAIMVFLLFTMLSGEYSYYLDDPVSGTDRSGHFQASICSAIRLPPSQV